MSTYFTGSRLKWARDVFERVAWTAAEVLLAAVVVTAWGLPEWLLAPAAAGVAVLKGVVARHVGNPESAAIGLPAGS